MLIAADNTTFLKDAIEHIENESSKTSNIYNKAIFLDKINQWLFLLMKTDLTDLEFYDLLKQAQPSIHCISPYGHDIAHFLYPGYECKSIEVTFEGKSTKAFCNTLESRYAKEVESYREHGIFSRRLLTAENFNCLKLDVKYCYVVTLTGELLYCELQDFDWIADGNVKRLIAPNHPVLAEGQPILAAGEMVVMGIGNKKIYQVSTTSGHYCPDYISYEHVIKILANFGVKSEQIIPTVFLIQSIPWKFIVKASREYTPSD